METIPGGYYIGVDGQAHDAEGRPIQSIQSVEKFAPPEDTAVVASKTKKRRDVHVQSDE